MDGKEIALRGKAIEKAQAEGDGSSSLINLLTELKDGMRATEDLLRQTRIGVVVNRLRTYKDPAVGKMASDLVLKWRNEVKKAGPKPGAAKPAASPAPTPKGTPANGAASPAPPPSATASPAPAATKKKHNIKPAERTDKTDKVNTNITGDGPRDACIKLMYNGLAFMSEEREYINGHAPVLLC